MAQIRAVVFEKNVKIETLQFWKKMTSPRRRLC